MNQSRCKLINQLGPICKTRKDLLFSKSPTEDATCFDEREFDGKDDGTFFMCSSKCSPPISFSPRSQALRFDITNYSVSLLNLDAEDCELISEKDHLEFDRDLWCDFPSPSYHSFLTSSRAQEFRSEMDWESAASGFEDLECNIDEEPLFWPFESLKLDWDSAKETWCFFSMSPRKNTETFRRNLFEIRRAEKLTRRNNREARVISRSPSRLSREPRNCEKVKESDELELEVDPIEMLLGLDAFDGREGVDSEFNQRHFSLVDSL